jgi:hypothetical protein
LFFKQVHVGKIEAGASAKQELFRDSERGNIGAMPL